MQEFYNSCQKPDELVTSFGCRLERTLQLAIDHGHFVSQSKNDMLRRWDQTMESMEERNDSKIDEKFNLILQKLDQKPADHGGSYGNKPQDWQNNYGRGRGYGNPNRYIGRPGYGRGRGRGRGQSKSSGYLQSSQTDPLNG